MSHLEVLNIRTQGLRLRSPDQVMAPWRAGAAYPNALSFARSLVRRMQRERWRIEPERIDLDAEGRGELLFHILAGAQIFRFFAISDYFPPEQKVDRSFGVNWDVSAALCQGEWTAEREALLREEIPKQYDGRYDADVLCFCRGNRSERIFEEMVDSLAVGRQPDIASLVTVGYILRSTAFAGNGLFGMTPFEALGPGHALARPYHAQMLAAYMLRESAFAIVDRVAMARGAGSLRLDRRIRRYLGIGNSAGLGLIPFLAAHPRIVHCWTLAHETAFAEAKARTTAPHRAAFSNLLDRAIVYFGQEARDGNGIFASYELLRSDLSRVREHLATGFPAEWCRLTEWVEDRCHPETVEILNSLFLELYPDVVDRADAAMIADNRAEVDPTMTVSQLKELISRNYAWALPGSGKIDPDFGCFWYYPEEAPYEPRRGVRGIAPAYETETPMDLPLRLGALMRRLEEAPDGMAVGTLVAVEPTHHAVIARVQSLADCDYAEFRQNYLSDAFTPFSACRFLLAFYGMEKYDPRPPRSTKGALLQGAPLPDEIAAGHAGDWPFPLAPVDDPAAARPARPSYRLIDAQDPPSAKDLPARRITVRRSGGVHLFSVELRKLLQRAQLAAGVPAGTAATVAMLIERAEAIEEGALAALIDELEREPARRSAGRIVAMFETACAAAGVGTVAVTAEDAPCSIVAQALPVAAAERGFVGVLADVSRSEVIIAAPRRDHVSLLRVPGATPQWALRGAAPSEIGAADWLLAPDPEARNASGARFLCLSPAPFHPAALPADIVGRPDLVPNCRAVDVSSALIRGFDLDACRHARLEQAAKRGLIPSEIEAGLRLGG